MLHRSNKKFADKISVLEQAVEMKSDSLTSMKETHKASVKALKRDEAQKKEIEDKKTDIKTLKDRKASLEQTIRDKNRNISQLNSKHKENLSHKDKEIKALEDAHQLVIEEVSDKIITLENNFIEKEYEVASLKKTQAKEIDEFKANTSRLEEQIREKSTNIELLEANNQKMLEEMQTHAKEYAQNLENKDTLFKETEDTHKERMHEATERIGSLEHEMIENEKRTKKMQAHYKREIENLEENRLSLQQTMVDKQSTIEDLERKELDIIKEAQKEKSTFEKEISKQHIKINQLTLEYEKKVDIAHKNIDLLKQDLENEREDKKAKIAAYLAEKQNFEKKNHDLEVIIGEYKEEIEVLQHKDVANKKQTSEMRNSLEKSLASKEKEKEKMEVLNSDLMQKIDLKVKLIKEEQAKYTAYQNQSNITQETLKSEIQALKSRDEEKKKVHVIQVAKFEKERKNVAHIREKCALLEEEILEKNRTLLHLNKAYEKEKEVSKELSIFVENKKKLALEVENKMQKLENALALEKSNYAEVDAKYRSMLKEEKIHQENLEKNVYDLRQKLEEKEKVGVNVQALQKALEQSRKQLQSYDAVFKNKEKEIVQIKASLEKQKETYAMLGNKYNDLKDLYNKQKQDLLYIEQEKKDKLSKWRSKQEEGIKAYQKGIVSLQKELIDQKEMYQQVKVKMLSLNSQLYNYKHENVENTLLHELEVKQLKTDIEIVKEALHTKQKLVKKENDKGKTTGAYVDILECIHAGESKEDVAKKFVIPVKKVELMMKFDKIKKVKEKVI